MRRRARPDATGVAARGAARVAACVALLAAACGGGDAHPAGRLAARVDTLDGVVRVHYQGRAPLTRLTPELSIGEPGGLDAPSPAEFGRVRSVSADGDGRVYVADGHALEVRVFDPDGRFLRALGRKGSGPGELEGLHGAAWLSPDTLVLVDYGNARLGLVDREGRALGQWPWMRATGPIRFFFSVAPGQFYAHGIRAAVGPGATVQRVDPVWVRYGLDGPVDSLEIPTLTAPVPGGGMLCRGDGLGAFANPYGDRLLAVPAPGGERIVAMASRYRLAFLDAAGDTVRILGRDVEAVPLTDQEWRTTADELAEFRERWRGAACEGDIHRPRNLPVLRDLGFDHDGRLLVELNTPSGPALDLYDADWRWLATLSLPDRDRAVPVYLRDDRLYLVARDSLDVQRVEVHRIAGPGP